MNSDEERFRQEEKERERNRRQVENRARQWAVAGDDDQEDDRKGRRKDEKKHRRHRRSPSVSSRSSGSEERRSRKRHRRDEKKKHRKKKRHKKKRHYSDESSSMSDSDSSSSRDRKKKRKKKKHKKSKADKKESVVPAGAGSFGKYGIIKPSDFHKQQRSFEVWMGEVKGIPAFTGPKWELQNYFAEYCEDFNTATLPHEKYYNYDDWEMKEYQKRQAAERIEGGGAVADEARHRAMLEKQRREKQQAELNEIKARMGKDKIEEMKHQALLKSTMAHAYKTGDEETRQRLQKKLEPEDDRNKKTAAHPWAK